MGTISRPHRQKFHERLAWRREKAGYSVARCANAAGVSPDRWLEFEAGHEVPRKVEIQRVFGEGDQLIHEVPDEAEVPKPMSRTKTALQLVQPKQDPATYGQTLRHLRLAAHSRLADVAGAMSVPVDVMADVEEDVLALSDAEHGMLCDLFPEMRAAPPSVAPVWQPKAPETPTKKEAAQTKIEAVVAPPAPAPVRQVEPGPLPTFPAPQVIQPVPLAAATDTSDWIDRVAKAMRAVSSFRSVPVSSFELHYDGEKAIVRILAGDRMITATKPGQTIQAAANAALDAVRADLQAQIRSHMESLQSLASDLR